mmetsp:Transcript_611/g.1365  ORF Transcript_611/g.1365 Transcript_611/m.1365 type:complete len:239 (+) Transcript_611:561-1277(+)
MCNLITRLQRRDRKRPRIPARTITRSSHRCRCRLDRRRRIRDRPGRLHSIPRAVGSLPRPCRFTCHPQILNLNIPAETVEKREISLLLLQRQHRHLIIRTKVTRVNQISNRLTTRAMSTPEKREKCHRLLHTMSMTHNEVIRIVCLIIASPILLTIMITRIHSIRLLGTRESFRHLLLHITICIKDTLPALSTAPIKVITIARIRSIRMTRRLPPIPALIKVIQVPTTRIIALLRKMI